MRPSLGLLVALSALALAAAADDEFDAHVAPAASEPVSGAAHGTPLPPPPASLTARLASRDWTLEACVVAAVALYVVAYVRGRAANAAIARSVLDALRPTLDAQFTAVGAVSPGDADAKAGEWTAESDNAFSLWSSGRRDCKGMLLELALRPRQDAVASLVAPRVPVVATVLSLPATAQDQLTIEVALEEAGAGVDGFVLCAAASPADMRALTTAQADVVKFASKTVSGSSLGLADAGGGGGDLGVSTEHRDIALAALAGAGALGPLMAPGSATRRAFRSLHATSEAALSSLALRAMSPRVVRVTVALPDAAAERGPLARAWVAGALALADHLARVRHSGDAKAAVADAREAVRRDAARKAADAEAAKRRAEAEAERQRERAALLQGLDRGARRKLEIKERKDALAAQHKKQVKRV